jgi:hypothetical protein
MKHAQANLSRGSSVSRNATTTTLAKRAAMIQPELLACPVIVVVRNVLSGA